MRIMNPNPPSTPAIGSGDDANPLSTTLIFVFEFLIELNAARKSYSMINVHRLMLSRTLPLVEAIP
ncbi:Uncharacterized protein APZ42_028857 [Daphnia magna]|uniref:Uncharacterized protein n=1 Tax=Daphnia magna TaxID=35525 RepID=A0A164Q4G9_9CRUS|nr:Uncharacterized protein APZ42_028857 [Daphnia magna]